MKLLKFSKFLFFITYLLISHPNEIKADLSLGVLNQKQPNENTCWARCAMVVLHWYEYQITYTDMFNYATCGDENDPNGGYLCGVPDACSCGNLSFCHNSISQILSNFSQAEVSSNCIGIINFNQIKAYIDNGQPIVARITWKTGSGSHFVVICGYNNSQCIQYMDPTYGTKQWESFEAFCNNSIYSFTNALGIVQLPVLTFNTNNLLNFNTFKFFTGLTDGQGGHLGDEDFCVQWTQYSNCTPVAPCMRNVHKQPTLLWFSNVSGQKFSYPISFPARGIYTIILTCRGSICSQGGSNSNCWFLGSSTLMYLLKDIGSIATITLSSSNNYINGKNTVTGTDLDRIAYSGWDNANPPQPVVYNCRPYTYKYKDVSVGYSKFKDNPMMEPGDIDVSFTAYIVQPSVENVTITMGSSLRDETGFSIHKIQTSFVRDFTYGCKNNSCATNYNPNVDFDDGSCVSKTIPTKPSNLTAIAVSPTQINLAWADNSNNESGFTVYWSTNGGSSFSQLTSSPTQNATTYSVTGLTANTSCQFKIQACNCAGCSDFSNTISATTLHVPNVPTILSATPYGNSIAINWTDNADNETEYEIKWATSSGAGPSSIKIAANSTSYTISNLLYSIAYQVSIRANNSIGSSAWVNASLVTTGAPPVGKGQSVFTGSSADWPYVTCTCNGSTYDCSSAAFTGYTIVWGDGVVETKTGNFTIYSGVLFSHLYNKVGTYNPYVIISYVVGWCGNSTTKTKTRILSSVVVKANITPILNLLLGD